MKIHPAIARLTLAAALDILTHHYQTCFDLQDLELVSLDGSVATIKVSTPVCADAENGPSPDDIPEVWLERVDLERKKVLAMVLSSQVDLIRAKVFEVREHGDAEMARAQGLLAEVRDILRSRKL